MPFQPAKFESRTNRVAPPMRYAVRTCTGKKPSMSLVLLFTNAVAAKCGFREGQQIRLDFDKARKLGRLTPIQSGSRQVRAKKGSMSIQFPHNGEIAQCFPAKGCTTELEIVETSKAEGLTFSLP